MQGVEMKEELDSVNEVSKIDNKRLEELIMIGPEYMDDVDQKEFLDLLREAVLFVPIEMKESGIELENIDVGSEEKTKVPSGFNFIHLTNNAGERTIAVFTREELMDKIGLKVERIPLYMRDLANMLKGATDIYSAIMINPNTRHSIAMSLVNFLRIFDEKQEDPVIESMKRTLYLFETNSIELEDHQMFFLRSDYELMQQQSVDGIFKTKVAFAVSTSEEFQSQLPILQKIMMMKGQKVLYTGDPENKEPQMDILIAPETEFEKFYDEDGDTSVWRCVRKPFYDG